MTPISSVLQLALKWSLILLPALLPLSVCRHVVVELISLLLKYLEYVHCQASSWSNGISWKILLVKCLARYSMLLAARFQYWNSPTCFSSAMQRATALLVENLGLCLQFYPHFFTVSEALLLSLVTFIVDMFYLFFCFFTVYMTTLNIHCTNLLVIIHSIKSQACIKEVCSVKMNLFCFFINCTKNPIIQNVKENKSSKWISEIQQKMWQVFCVQNTFLLTRLKCCWIVTFLMRLQIKENFSELQFNCWVASNW